jgi:tetraacyldisaccharide 4'-kinase
LTFDASLLPEAEEAGDEPRLIARRCPGVRLYVGADRVASALRAQEDGAKLLLLDDGFQHRRLARDVDLVVVDGTGNGHLMPWGPLREPACAIARASFVWLKGAGVSPGSKPIVRAEHVAVSWIDAAGAEQPLESLRGQSVVALAGIARPRGFLDSLNAAGVTLAAAHLYGDHHRFTAAELEACTADAKRLNARVVTTEKDAERLPDGFEASRLRLGVRVTEGLDALAAALGLDPALA